MGLSILYYDVVNLMALGTAKQVASLDELLQRADFVTLHVPELPETTGMIGAPQLAQMRAGSYLINASRGRVVDIPALVDALRSGRLAGAALDVYPSEPAGNGDYFSSASLGGGGSSSSGGNSMSWVDDLRGLRNVILTPHIGGSTEEAQRAIGLEGMRCFCFSFLSLFFPPWHFL